MRKRNGAPWPAWTPRIILGSPRSCWCGEQNQRPDNESNVTSYFLSRAHLPGNYLGLSLASGSPPSATSLDDVSIFHTVLTEVLETQNEAPKLLLSPSPPLWSPSPMLPQLTPRMGVLLLEQAESTHRQRGTQRGEEMHCRAILEVIS